MLIYISIPKYISTNFQIQNAQNSSNIYECDYITVANLFSPSTKFYFWILIYYAFYSIEYPGRKYNKALLIS